MTPPFESNDKQWLMKYLQKKSPFLFAYMTQDKMPLKTPSVSIIKPKWLDSLAKEPPFLIGAVLSTQCFSWQDDFLQGIDNNQDIESAIQHPISSTQLLLATIWFKQNQVESQEEKND